MITLPKKVFLTAINKEWKISYLDSPGKLIIIEHPHRELALYGKNYAKQTALHLITRWTILKAQHHLIATLKKLNRKVKAKYKKIMIRSHEAQWGSCSSNKTISLNYKLIFLPPNLVNHVIIHELCHINDMSHSEDFWQTVEKYDPDCEENKIALGDADEYMPAWVS